MNFDINNDKLLVAVTKTFAVSLASSAGVMAGFIVFGAAYNIIDKKLDKRKQSKRII